MSINGIVLQYKEIQDMMNKIYDYYSKPKIKKIYQDISISWEYDFLKFPVGGHWVNIRVDNILVYRDYFVHNIPKEMKQQIKEEINNIKQWNKEQIKNGIYRKYNDLIKNQEKQEKEREHQKFLKEQQYLLNKYNTTKV